MKFEVIIDDINQRQWEEYARNFSDYSIYQTWPYQEYRAKQDGQQLCRIVVLGPDQKVAIMGHLRIKHIKPLGLKIGYMQRGPLLHLDEISENNQIKALQAMKESVLNMGVNIFRIMPNIASNEEGGNLARDIQSAGFNKISKASPYRTFELPVNDSEEGIRKRLRKSFRRDLKKAEKTGLEIKQGSDQHYSDILEELYSGLKERKQFKGLNPQEFIQPQRKLSSPEKLHFIVAYQKDEPIAALLASNLGDTGVVLLAASNDKGLASGASYVIWYQGAVAACQAGMKYYDLGGINPDTNPSVYQFKSRLGGREVSHVGTFEITSNVLVKAIWYIVEKLHHITKKE